MFDSLKIQSHKGPYQVFFDSTFSTEVFDRADLEFHFIVDENVGKLYAPRLARLLARPSTILIDATEETKSLRGIIPIFERLIESKVRRDHVLVAIGGGIVQDITCFISSTLLRGVPWHFVPTTLLAQADSCIGSKSSINIGATKNIIGTFNPPRRVHVFSDFLDTLGSRDIRSGIGEIIKVHVIEGVEAFDRMCEDFGTLLTDRAVQLRYIESSLRIKKRFIEEDEFDTGIRAIFNYGHSFGHALESASNYQLPHGIAVSIGMDMANFLAHSRGLLPRNHYDRMAKVLRENYEDFLRINIDLDSFLSALMRDKKNTTSMLRLILPVGNSAEIQQVSVVPDLAFRDECTQFLIGLQNGYGK